MGADLADPLFERTRILVGEAGLERLAGASLLLAGLGGVGSYAAEALARAGVGRLTLADHDRVAGSNLNRQLPALRSTVGRKKIEVTAERIADINPACGLTLHDTFLDPDNIPAVLEPGFDFVIDAIDSLNCKAALVAEAHGRRIPVASSMGAGGKSDPTRVVSGDLMDSDVCPLARQMRKRLRKRGVGRGVLAVWSLEPGCAPLPPEPTERGRARAVNGTLSYMPALFGLTLAGLAIRRIAELG
jgi:tRNA A37 threonylcarbamoyladenosine dehydratase